MLKLFKQKFSSRASLAKHTISFGLCLVLGLIALQIPFREIIGTSRSFTLFDFLAPTLGALWGTGVGMVSVLVISVINLFVQGDFSTSALIRLVPVLFAVYYFARRSRASALIGVLAMVLFIAHPVGRQAWQYSLFWLIPVVTQLVGRKNVLISALGATFTQHAVGSVAFLYAYSFTPAYWKSLIPVVMGERLVLALGIVTVYAVLQAVVAALPVEIPGFKKARSLFGFSR